MDELLEQIWSGDKLGRRKEARILQSFVEEEIADRLLSQRNQSYVIAVDAIYGEGKTWFLSRFKEQLKLSHPVAWIDAWVDDGNDEPLVAIMAAIEDALEPYIGVDQSLRDRFAAASRALFPIISKALAGAGTKLLQRHVGDAIFDEASEELRKAQSNAADKKTALEDAIDKSVDKAGDAVGALIDRQAEEMISAYRQRQASREMFKNNMALLVENIDSSSTNISGPFFVIVDELDRCRPDYAIKVLEEIKHFFDVPGVVFIIGLHGDQLTRSVRAVYGADFDSAAYLRRFFNRRYELRRLSVNELVEQELRNASIDVAKLHAPTVAVGQQYVEMSPAEFIAKALDDLAVRARELHGFFDFLRIFERSWNHRAKAQLVLLIPMIINVLRHKAIFEKPVPVGNFSLAAMNSGSSPSSVHWLEVFETFRSFFQMNFSEITHQNRGYRNGAHGVVLDILMNELQVEHGGSYPSNRPPLSIINSYEDRLLLIDRFVQQGEAS